MRMAGYAIVTIQGINDIEKLQLYREAAVPIIKQFGGEALVTSRGNQQFVEGKQGVCVIVYKFPSYEQAVNWYNSPEYSEAKDTRIDAAEVQFILAEGLD